MLYSMNQLKNSGSKAMNVNGATTPVTFTYTASSYQEVTSIVCILRDEGNTSFSNFGAKPALTNGVLIQVTQGGTTRTIATLKDNADVCLMFPTNQFGNGAVLSILSIVTPEGFGDTNNCFVGVLTLKNQIPLNSSDTITVTVQDNLSGVGTFQMACGTVMD